MNISRREKKLIIIAALGTAAALFYHFALRPAMQRSDALRERIIPEKQEQLAELRELSEEYRILKEDIQHLSGDIPEPEADFSPLSFLEEALQQSGIASWSLDRPRQERNEGIMQVSIDVQIDDTGWEELITFFQSLDAAEPALRLSSMDIRRQRRRNHGLQASVTVSGLRRPD